MPDNRRELIKYRLESARERLNSAEVLLASKSYAMFTAVRALLAKEGVDYSKHAGVISYFQREYIKTQKFEKKYSKYLSQAFQIRNNTDYADFFVVSFEDAREQADRAKEFLTAIEEFLKA